MTGEAPDLSAPSSSQFHQEAWELVAEGDWLVGQRFPISRHAVLGRDSSCDITIPGTHLSRRHAELAVKGSTLLIRDLNSSNGTYVNDKKITETALKPGDSVRFDVLRFKVHGPGEQKQAASNNASDANATLIRRPDSAHKRPAAAKPTPTAKRWKTKPTSVGNRQSTMQMNSVQKTTSSAWTILAIVVGLGTVAAIGYLLTYL